MGFEIGGFGVRVQEAGSGVWGLWSRVCGWDFGVQGFEIGVLGLRFQFYGIRVSRFGISGIPYLPVSSERFGGKSTVTCLGSTAS